jgi:hypothetical protein
MQLGSTDQTPEVPRILGHEHAVFVDAPGEDPVVRLAAAPDMERMDGIVAACLVETRGELR